MSNQEEDVLKEIIVLLKKPPFPKNDRYSVAFRVPQAITKHHSINQDNGIRCVLVEKSNNAKMKNAEKIDKEILIDVMDDDYKFPAWAISHETCHLYDINPGNYLHLLIKEIIR